MSGVFAILLLALAGPPVVKGVPLEAVAETTANASLGDLDGDGDPDIVLAKGRHWPLPNLILRNGGAGRFNHRYPVGLPADRSYTAALADLDGDGDLDLVVGNDRPDEKRALFGDGNGGFLLAGTWGEPSWSTRNITLADLDGDQRPEIVAANRGADTPNFICRNDGAGAFPTCEELSRASATTIAAGDLTGDGAIDLFVPHRDGGQSRLFVNDGDGRFSQSLAVGPAVSATRAIALADWNGDGRLDILAGDQRETSMDGGVWLHLNRGGGRFETPVPMGRPEDNAYALATADLDGDGDIDAVVGNRQTPGAILLNEGDGEIVRIPFGDGEGAVYGLAIGDVDADGTPDIVAARSGAPSMLYRIRFR